MLCPTRDFTPAGHRVGGWDGWVACGWGCFELGLFPNLSCFHVAPSGFLTHLNIYVAYGSVAVSRERKKPIRLFQSTNKLSKCLNNVWTFFFYIWRIDWTCRLMFRWFNIRMPMLLVYYFRTHVMSYNCWKKSLTNAQLCSKVDGSVSSLFTENKKVAL